MSNRRLSHCVGIFAMLLTTTASSAYAQEAEEPVDLGTLILRGTKIGQTADDAPPSIAVIDGDTASAPINQDLDDIIAGEANVLANEGLIPPSIRGIGGLGGDRPAITAGAQPRVPIVVDDVALPSGEASNIAQSSTWDLDSVEVARGPQATSTGRNTLGGAIRVFTKDPSFEREGALRFRFTDQSEQGMDFMFNTPLIEDQLAFRLTGEYTGGDSYITNPSPLPSGLDPNEESYSKLRAKLLWEPLSIPGLSVLLTAEDSRTQGPTEGFYNGDIDDLSVTGLFALSSAYETVDQTILSARAEYALSKGTTIVARMSNLQNELLFADTGESLGPGFTFGETGFDKDISEAEVYAVFENQGIVKKGVLGLIHTVEDEVGFNRGGVLAFNLTGEIENTALFGEVEIDAGGIAPGLSVIAGGRLERDKRTRTSFDEMGNLVGTGTFSEEVFLPKLGLRYAPNENTLLGYTYSEGFRGGGLDVDLGAPFSGSAYSSVAFGPEYVKQHEISAKTTTMNGALDLGATAFFYQWEDAQVSGAASYPISGDGAIGNVPEAEGYGLELNAAYRATPNLTFTGAIGLLETEITNAGGLAGAQGQELPLSPNTTASLGLAYQSNSGFDASVKARYVGSQQAALNQNVLDSFTVVDLAAGYQVERPNGQAFRFDAYVANVFDERYETFSEPNAFGGLQQVGKPRTVGFSMTWTF
ncbi:MAG: TonB-dependent receptor [Pseudomonadota bacterium]